MSATPGLPVTGFFSQKFLAARLTTKIKGLSRMRRTQRIGFVHSHSTNRVFWHGHADWMLDFHLNNQKSTTINPRDF
jgi:hypothetical protein